MNLHDVVPLKKAAKAQKVADTEVLGKAMEAAQLFKQLGLQVPRELYETATGKSRASRVAAFHANGGLLAEADMKPMSVGYSGLSTDGRDSLSKLAESPRTTIADLRNVADALGMAIMPFGVVNEKSIKNESYETRRQIEGFERACKHADLELYVVAPISLYAIHQHVSMNGDAPGQEFYSREFQHVFTTIQLQIPLFRTIMGSINGLETRVAGLENMTTQIKAQVESIQRQLDSLQQEANRRREAEARQAAAAAAAAIAAAQAQFYAVDPLAFAVMKGTSLTDESSPAIIGPAWGPDFPPELAVAFNLVQKRNQRATLANRMKELFW